MICSEPQSSHGDSVNALGNDMIDSELLTHLASSARLEANPVFQTTVGFSSQQSNPWDGFSQGVPLHCAIRCVHSIVLLIPSSQH